MSNMNTNIPTASVQSAIRICCNLPPGYTVLLMGDSGIGKSAIPLEVARRLDGYTEEDVIDLRTASLSDGDTLGIPDLAAMERTGETSYAPPAWLARASRQPTILFLDELNRGQISIQNQFFQLVYDNELSIVEGGNSVKLHPMTRIFAAINVGNSYTGISEMDIALQRRFFPLEIQADLESWIDGFASAAAKPPKPRKLRTRIQRRDLEKFAAEHDVVESKTAIRFKDETLRNNLRKAEVLARQEQARLDSLTATSASKEEITSAFEALGSANAELISAMDAMNSPHPNDYLDVDYMWSNDYDHSVHGSRVDAIIIEYLMKHPENFHKMEGINNGGMNIFPNPASWTRCSDVLRQAGLSLEENAGARFASLTEAHQILYSFLGKSLGAEVDNFVRNIVGFITPVEYFFESSVADSKNNDNILAKYYQPSVSGGMNRESIFLRSFTNSFKPEVLRRVENGEKIFTAKTFMERMTHISNVFAADVTKVMCNEGINLFMNSQFVDVLIKNGWSKTDPAMVTKHFASLVINK